MISVQAPVRANPVNVAQSLAHQTKSHTSSCCDSISHESIDSKPCNREPNPLETAARRADSYSTRDAPERLPGRRAVCVTIVSCAHQVAPTAICIQKEKPD